MEDGIPLGDRTFNGEDLLRLGRISHDDMKVVPHQQQRYPESGNSSINTGTDSMGAGYVHLTPRLINADGSFGTTGTGSIAMAHTESDAEASDHFSSDSTGERVGCLLSF